MGDRRTRSKTKAMKNKEKPSDLEPLAKDILSAVVPSQLVGGTEQEKLASTHVLPEHAKTEPGYQTVRATGEATKKLADTLKISVGVAEEDLIDWEYEEEVMPSNNPQSAPVTKEGEGQNQPLDGENGSATKEVQEYTLEQQAKQTMIWSLESLLDYTPNLPAVLGLHNLGDVAMVQKTIRGVGYEVVWKIISAPKHDEETVAAIEEPVAILNDANNEDRRTPNPSEETNATTEAPVKISQPESHVHIPSALQQPLPRPETQLQAKVLDADPSRCKFGKNCKNPNCPYDHEILCAFVNTKQGCTNGKQCPFSHRHEGKPCAFSSSRNGCKNGFSCFFKHGDDFGVSVVNGQQVVKLPGLSVSPSTTAKQADTSTVETAAATDSGYKNTISAEIAAGTKRPREEEDGKPKPSTTVQPHTRDLAPASTNGVTHPPTKRQSFGGPPPNYIRGHGGRGRGRRHGSRGGGRGRGRSGFRGFGRGW